LIQKLDSWDMKFGGWVQGVEQNVCVDADHTELMDGLDLILNCQVLEIQGIKIFSKMICSYKRKFHTLVWNWGMCATHILQAPSHDFRK
jgi:hypothetical protein